MKKLLGMIAVASIFSIVMMGCSQPTEGDTAPPDTPKKVDDGKANPGSSGETLPPPPTK